MLVYLIVLLNKINNIDCYCMRKKISHKNGTI